VSNKSLKKQTKKTIVKKAAVNQNVTAKSKKSVHTKKAIKKSRQPKIKNTRSFITEQLMIGVGKVLVKVAAFTANAAIYNKEVGKRLDKRAHVALQVVGQLAQGVKEDIREGVKAANTAKKRKAQLKKTEVKAKKVVSRNSRKKA